jgi:hypothetical protein
MPQPLCPWSNSPQYPLDWKFGGPQNGSGWQWQPLLVLDYETCHDVRHTILNWILHQIKIYYMFLLQTIATGARAHTRTTHARRAHTRTHAHTHTHTKTECIRNTCSENQLFIAGLITCLQLLPKIDTTGIHTMQEFPHCHDRYI